MSGAADPAVVDAGAPAAPPRSNGELVFEEPWESRAFGLAVALHDAGVVDFEAFRAQLIAEIGAWEAEHGASAAGTATTSAGSPRSSGRYRETGSSTSGTSTSSAKRSSTSGRTTTATFGRCATTSPATARAEGGWQLHYARVWSFPDEEAKHVRTNCTL